jgi:hypothetical protein
VRVVERQAGREDQHFTEGEPDLEAPEELAVLEVDEETLLEEDLEKEVDLEDEMDEDLLENILDHLVHDGDDEDENLEDSDPAPGPASTMTVVAVDTTELDTSELDDLEIEDLEDREESLDRILREKLAGDEEAEAETDDLVAVGVTGSEAVTPTSCGRDEFVCRTCFLVRHESQRAATSEGLCQDCSG